MNTVGTLSEAIKRFVYNNSNAVDTFKASSPDTTFEGFLAQACMTAMNNARVYAEQNASFSWLDVTVSALFPANMSVNLNRLYPDDVEFYVPVGGVADWTDKVQYRYDRLGILQVSIPSIVTIPEFYEEQSYLDLKSLTFANNDFNGEFIVNEVLPNRAKNGVTWHVFKLCYRDMDITGPTAWTDPVTLPTIAAVFNEAIRMNAITAASFITDDGGSTPVDIDTRNSQHMRDIFQKGRGLVEDKSSNPTVIIDGRQLRLSYGGNTKTTISLSGTRWMKPYTSEDDTDFLLEHGFSFMMWQSILELNYIMQIFVQRQEGVLPPPENARNEAWSGLLVNDAFAGSTFYIQ